MKKIRALAKEYIISVSGKENPDMQHEIEKFLFWLINNNFTIRMNTPIIDPSTLTNRQKERIKELYIQSEHNRMLEGLFGEDFFKKGE